MKINQLKNFVLLTLLIAAIAGCKQKTSETFELKGKLRGITDGKIVLSGTMSESEKADTVPIKNGEFVFTTEVKEGAQYKLEIVGKEVYPRYFFAENVQMTLTGNADSLFNSKIEGGTISVDEKEFSDGENAILEQNKKEYGADSLIDRYNRNPSKELKGKLDTMFNMYQKSIDQYKLDFIKQHPKSYYSAILISYTAEEQSADELKESLKKLDPKLEDFALVQDLRQMIEDKKTTEVKVDAFTSNAPDIEYSVDKSYNGLAHKDMVYLAALPNDNILGLRKDGFVCTIDPKGKELSKFKISLKSTPSAMAVDQSNSNIYVLGTINETKEYKSRGKTTKYDEAKGAECMVYDSKGTELKKISIPELKSVTGAKVINNKLLIADFISKTIFIYDLTAGKIESKLKDLRTCCKILDFGINAKNEIIVANLGAFRVQAFDYSGKIKYAFGKRGQAINDFHGCCNPVNVASLTDGAIVTVEKDPTRIKIYSKSGAKQIDGIQELVRGCKYIPMICDSKNNLYLASAQSGIVKCSASKSK